MSSSKHKITVVSECQSPRLSYVLTHIFIHFWDCQFNIVNQSSEADGIVIRYGEGKDRRDDEIVIPRSSLLFEKKIEPLTLRNKVIDNVPIAFYISSGAEKYELEYDLFAFVFYLLSRYEEYLPIRKDEHGRFQSKNSWSSQNACLKQAVVDRAILQLGEILFNKYGVRLKQKNTFQIRPSFDIDLPYAYKYKGVRAYIGILRDILSRNIGGVQDRSKFWFSGVDPFDTYEEIQLLCRNHQHINCFLLQNWNPPFDLNHIVGTEAWNSIVKQLSSWSRVGIHPSYESNRSLEILREELNKLEFTLGQKINYSRQHFLKISLPDTYQHLIEMGIREDHSMSYPDQVGFRAGTTHPFYWYDLKREEATNLLIIPYAAMDATLRHYMKLSPEEAMQLILELKMEAQDVQGVFGFIWHNSSMSRAYGWQPWQKVLNTCLEELP